VKSPGGGGGGAAFPRADSTLPITKLSVAPLAGGEGGAASGSGREGGAGTGTLAPSHC